MTGEHVPLRLTLEKYQGLRLPEVVSPFSCATVVSNTLTRRERVPHLALQVVPPVYLLHRPT
jgi:hypothetical protein